MQIYHHTHRKILNINCFLCHYFSSYNVTINIAVTATVNGCIIVLNYLFSNPDFLTANCRIDCGCGVLHSNSQTKMFFDLNLFSWPEGPSSISRVCHSRVTHSITGSHRKMRILVLGS